MSSKSKWASDSDSDDNNDSSNKKTKIEIKESNNNSSSSSSNSSSSSSSSSSNSSSSITSFKRSINNKINDVNSINKKEQSSSPKLNINQLNNNKKNDIIETQQVNKLDLINNNNEIINSESDKTSIKKTISSTSISTVTDSPSKTEETTHKQPLIREHNALLHGCRSVDEYQRINYIDQGSYGMVFKAKCRKTNVLYALKQVKLTDRETSKGGFPITALRETNILLALNHPNIIRVKEMVVGSKMDKIYMVMDYSENDLKTCLSMSKQPFSTAEVKQLMRQLLSAVNHMHQNWYLHRDLKTSNLLYSNKGVLTVCDFGMARKYGQPLLPYTFEVVTLYYRSPELLLGEKIYSTPLDMWSVGCIFGEILKCGPLFCGEGEIDQLNKIFKILGAPNEDNWPGVSNLNNYNKISYRTPSKSKLYDLFQQKSFTDGVQLNETGFDLLSSLLILDPRYRKTCEDALNHKWLTEELPLPAAIDTMPKFQSRGD
jgi:cell division cycle 2-like protein